MKRKLIAVLVFLGILLLCLPALADTKLISTQSDLIYFLQGGGTGELQADVKLSQTVELTREGDLTWLDLKGHTLTLDQGAQLIIKSGSMTLMSSGGSKGVLTNGGLSNEDGLIHVHENSTLTLVYVNVFGADGYAQQVIHNEGILQLETDAYVRGYSQATIENTGSGMVAVTDSTVESLTNYTCCAIRSSSTADHAVVIKENALITSAAWAREPYLGTITLTGDRADVTALSVEGGTVTNTARSGGACIINTGAGTVSLSGGAVTTAAAYSIAVIGSGSGKTEVSGGSVEATGQNSYAMRCDGPVYVTDGSAVLRQQAWPPLRLSREVSSTSPAGRSA